MLKVIWNPILCVYNNYLKSLNSLNPPWSHARGLIPSPITLHLRQWFSAHILPTTTSHSRTPTCITSSNSATSAISSSINHWFKCHLYPTIHNNCKPWSYTLAFTCLTTPPRSTSTRYYATQSHQHPRWKPFTHLILNPNTRSASSKDTLCPSHQYIPQSAISFE